MSGAAAPGPDSAAPHRRRARYAGKHPRRFDQKYKERDPARHAGTVAKVLAAGKTPAGMHRPIMVAEILEVLAPRPGELAVDCTLGYGGHAREILPRLMPGGRLIGIDADPIELPKAEARLRDLGFGPEAFAVRRTNFAGLVKALADEGRTGADMVLADLGVSSMQMDDPARGFSMKADGPLDMRMNPLRGRSAADLLADIGPEALAALLEHNADEPDARALADAIAGRAFSGTRALVEAIGRALPRAAADAREGAVRRVFQALRIAVNDELAALDALLRVLPSCMNSGGRAAILTFHSGEDRRVKKAFEAGLAAGVYAEIARDVIRATPGELYANPRSAPAKLRWVRRR